MAFYLVVSQQAVIEGPGGGSKPCPSLGHSGLSTLASLLPTPLLQATSILKHPVKDVSWDGS